jgi:acyl-CoA dehydrogenase
LRDRLTEGVYIPVDNNEPVAQLEEALNRSIAAEPATGKLRKAMREGILPHGDPEHFIEAGVTAGVITEPEAEDIRVAIAARKIVIQVDEFVPEYLTKERIEWGQSIMDGVAGQSM